MSRMVAVAVALTAALLLAGCTGPLRPFWYDAPHEDGSRYDVKVST